MYHSAVEAYKNVQKTTMSGRDIEASVLSRAALMLKQCQDHWNDANHRNDLRDALKFNQLIWSIFQNELHSDENPLPKPLRVDILRLSAFIDRRIFEIMAYPAPEKLTAIININENLAAGLRGSPSGRS